jgi:hypothetical protein
MKLISAIFIFVVGLALGICAQGSHAINLHPVQVESPAYTCQFGNGGTSNAFPCAQYIVEVSTQRLGGGGVIVYQVTSSPFDVRGSNISTVAGGGISGTSVQALLPNSTTNTFTLAVSQP